MKIVDLNHCTIAITDLRAAIDQADNYRHCRFEDPAFAVLSNKLQAYWEDVYRKLKQLKPPR